MRVKGGGLGARERNTFKSIPWSVSVMGNRRTCYFQHLGAVALFLCPCLMYALLASLLSKNCSSTAKGETEHGAHWSLMQD